MDLQTVFFQKMDFLALDLKTQEITFFEAIVPRSEAPTKKVYVAVFPAGGMFSQAMCL